MGARGVERRFHPLDYMNVNYGDIYHAPQISILTWRCYAAARIGFSMMLRYLIKDEDPDIVIVLDTRVARTSC